MREIVLVNFKTRGAAYGIGTYIDELTHCLQQLNVKVTVVEADYRNNEFQVEESQRVKKLLFPLYYVDPDSLYFKRVVSLLKLHVKDSSDLVFQFNTYLHKGMLDQVKAKFPKAKTIFTVHFFQWSMPLLGDASRLYQLIEKRDKKPGRNSAPVIVGYLLEKEIYEKADRIVSLSDDTTSLLQGGYGIDDRKIFQMANGLRDVGSVDISFKDKFRKQFHIGRGEILLLFVGRLDPIKGVNPLLSSFQKIVDRYDNCRLVLIGEGDSTIFQNHTRVMSRVIVTGRISKAEVSKWYCMADIGVFPSFYEECSYVGIEMMMHGLPIIASDGYSVRNMFHGGKNALVAKQETRQSNKAFKKNLFDCLTRLIESKTLREQLATGSRKAYEEKYGAYTMTKNYRHLLDFLT